jgi:competence protein ComEC
MIVFALSFVFGAWLLQQCAALPSLAWSFSLALPLALVYFKRSPHWLLSLTLGALAGLFWANALAHWRLADSLPSQSQGVDIAIVGVVANLPQKQEHGQRFEFDVEQVLSPQQHVPRHIALSSYGTGFKPAANTPAQFHAGERWQLTVRLKQPHGTANPYTFDFEYWALEHNIRATGYIRPSTPMQRLQHLVYQPPYLLQHLRENIAQRMHRVLAHAPAQAVLQALVIGEENEISQNDWQMFLNTGTNHLMSISGLHITMLAGLALSAVYALWRRSSKLTLWLPARKAAVLAGAGSAFAYTLIAGFSVPSQRTLYMLLVFGAALWSSRHIHISRVLAYALLIVTVLDPWAVLAPGFWLSFGAVALISYALAGRIQNPHWLHAAVTTQWAVTLGLMPLLIAMFQQISVVSPIANALAIPVVSLIVAPLSLLGALLPIDFLLHLAASIMQLTMQALHWLAYLPHSTWQLAAPPAWTVALALLGVVCLLLPRGFPLRALGLCMFVPICWLKPVSPVSGAMQITFLDVGQGLAVLVQTQNHNLLYDTGPRFNAQSDSGNKIILPFLRAQGIQRLDGLIVSHNDLDHSGGLNSILAQIPSTWLASSLPSDTPELKNQPHIPCAAGQSWQWDKVKFSLLAPTAASYQDPSIKDNNRSCVVKISSLYGSALLTGDIEQIAESELLVRAADSATGTDLHAELMSVPHHGSKTSSSPDFIATVQPKIAVFSVGYRNRFRHPRPQILARYTAQGSQTYRSDRDGALSFNFVPDTPLQATAWRQQKPRYWQTAWSDE